MDDDLEKGESDSDSNNEAESDADNDEPDKKFVQKGILIIIKA